MDDFIKIYDMCFHGVCPPTEGVKEKADGCFNALNDYGKEPTRRACIKCWREAMKAALTQAGGD